MGWLEGKSARITGGAAGLGRAVAERFLAEGAEVGILDISEQAALAVAGESGGRIVATIGDVRSLGDNRAAVEAMVARHGKLDIFVANAAVWDYSTALVDLPDDRIGEAFDEVFWINVKGYLLGAKAALPALVKAKGNMIFTVSNAGFYPAGGGPLYTGAKHAVVGLVKQLAYETAPHVRVNGVAPGAIRTDLTGPKSLGLDGQAMSSLPLDDLIAATLPLPRVASPADYAGYYVLLASDANGGTATGSIINCDGGFGARGLTQPAGGADLPARFG